MERIGDESLTCLCWLFVHRNIWGSGTLGGTIFLITVTLRSLFSVQKLTFTPLSRTVGDHPETKTAPEGAALVMRD